MPPGYPKYNSAAKMGELGVQAVSKIINNFGWIFKRNPQETDFGIDGQIDVITDDGFVTGQMFSVQIKHGKSFFQEKNNFGYIYRGEGKHFNYLTNYPTIVIIIICHPCSKKCYWVVFNPTQTMLTGNNWKITIPFNHDLLLSKNKIQETLPPLIDGLTQLQNYWTLNNIIMSCDYIAYYIDIFDVKNLISDNIRSFFDRLLVTKELAYHCMGKIELGIYGYDEDERELFEIEEVREFIKFIDPLIPELFFFVRTNDPTNTLILFAISLVDVHLPFGKNLTKNKKIRIEIKPEQLESFLMTHFDGLNKITDWLGFYEEDNERITSSILRCLFPNETDAIINEF